MKLINKIEKYIMYLFIVYEVRNGETDIRFHVV
jgi:hypothetical protein